MTEVFETLAFHVRKCGRLAVRAFRIRVSVVDHDDCQRNILRVSGGSLQT